MYSEVDELFPSDVPCGAELFYQIPQSFFVPSLPSFSWQSNDIGSFCFYPCFFPDFYFIAGAGLM